MATGTSDVWPGAGCRQSQKPQADDQEAGVVYVVDVGGAALEVGLEAMTNLSGGRRQRRNLSGGWPGS